MLKTFNEMYTLVSENESDRIEARAQWEFSGIIFFVIFFVQLKGVTVAADAYEEIENIIADLDLEDIRKIRAKDLSRGQKRLVHVAIAFGGGSKVSFRLLSKCSFLHTQLNRLLFPLGTDHPA